MALLGLAFLGLSLLGCSRGGEADRLQVAVASNFAKTARAIAQAFTEQEGIEVVVVPGATGKHYAQILHGAPFDLFLAADRERPQRLEEAGLVPGPRAAYAFGRLAMWAPQAEDLRTLTQGGIPDGLRHFAIANPDLAPYGRAAVQALQGMELWGALQDRLVRGENIAQCLHFIDSGGAAAGLVALSQVQDRGRGEAGWWEVPSILHDPIEQQVVVVSGHPQARPFFNFLLGSTAQALIREAGYGLPDA